MSEVARFFFYLFIVFMFLSLPALVDKFTDKRFKEIEKRLDAIEQVKGKTND